MKRLFYLSGTLFFLSLTLLVGIHIGQQRATAAPKGSPIAAYVRSLNDFNSGPSVPGVILANGDVYRIDGNYPGLFATRDGSIFGQ